MKLLLPSTTSANWNFNNFCVPVNALLDRNIVYPVNQPPRPSQLWSLYMLCSFLPQQDWLCDPSQRVSIFLSLFLFLYSIKTSFLGPLNGDCPFHEVFKKKKKRMCLHHLILFFVKVVQSLLTLCDPMGYIWLTCWSTEVRTHHPVLGSGTFPGKRPGMRRRGQALREVGE